MTRRRAGAARATAARTATAGTGPRTSPARSNWNLPDAQHTHAIREHADEYEQRVVGFLNEALL
jgi:hypothetical protein